MKLDNKHGKPTALGYRDINMAVRLYLPAFTFVCEVHPGTMRGTITVAG